MTFLRATWCTALATVVLATAVIILNRPTARRPRKLPPSSERVLILGASSGIGRSLAHIYASRGTHSLCLVARRKHLLDTVVQECLALDAANGENRVLSLQADFSNPEDMIRIRDTLENEWHGIDTVIVAAGVSALRPLLAVAGLEPTDSNRTRFKPEKAGPEAIAHTVQVVNTAAEGNYLGPLISAITLIPLLSQSSPSPSILLLSSLAAVIPAPTRSIYASTKSAALLLYQALSIEHPNIAFSVVLPYTVEGDFRASAVDGGPVREPDPGKTGLRREEVAKRCVRAVDRGERTVFMPGYMKLGMALYWIWPGLMERMARRKYKF